VAAAESYPDDLKYHEEHDWARVEGNEAVLGITWFAADAQSYGEVESVKAVSDVIAPLSGEVLEVNERVVDAPETVNEDPYGNGWLLRVRVADSGEVGALLDAGAYRELLASQ
jgi:glycine cleavage system H protein